MLGRKWASGEPQRRAWVVWLGESRLFSHLDLFVSSRLTKFLSANNTAIHCHGAVTRPCDRVSKLAVKPFERGANDA